MRQVYGTHRIDAHGQVLDQEEAMLRQDAESHLLLAHLVSERESSDPLRRNKHTTGVDHQDRPSTFSDDSMAALLDLELGDAAMESSLMESFSDGSMAALLAMESFSDDSMAALLDLELGDDRFRT